MIIASIAFLFLAEAVTANNAAGEVHHIYNESLHHNGMLRGSISSANSNEEKSTVTNTLNLFSTIRHSRVFIASKSQSTTETQIVELTLFFFVVVLSFGIVVGCVLCAIPHFPPLKKLVASLFVDSAAEQDISGHSSHDLLPRSTKQSQIPTHHSHDTPTRSVPEIALRPRPLQPPTQSPVAPQSSTLLAVPAEKLRMQLPKPGSQPIQKYPTSGLQIKKKSRAK